MNGPSGDKCVLACGRQRSGVYLNIALAPCGLGERQSTGDQGANAGEYVVPYRVRLQSSSSSSSSMPLETTAKGKGGQGGEVHVPTVRGTYCLLGRRDPLVRGQK